MVVVASGSQSHGGVSPLQVMRQHPRPRREPGSCLSLQKNVLGFGSHKTWSQPLGVAGCKAGMGAAFPATLPFPADNPCMQTLELPGFFPEKQKSWMP